MPQQPATSYADDLAKVRASYASDLAKLRESPDQAPPGPAPGVSGSFSDFAKGIWNSLNPSGLLHPLDTIQAMGQAQGAEFEKAKTEYSKGNTGTAAAHLVAWLAPVVGPAADNIIQTIKSGRISEGLGQLTGAVAPFVAGDVTLPKAPALADAMAAKGASTLADVISPVKGANKTRFANMAQDVAPALAAEPGLGAGSVAGLAAKVGDKLTQAEEGLDAAHAARLKGKPIPTQPILAALQRQLDSLTAQPLDGSLPSRELGTKTSPIVDTSGKPIVTETATAKPIGQDVLPAPNAARAQPLQQAIAEVRALGPITSYDALRTIRQAYDAPAKAIYSPSMTADYMKVQGGKLGAADVTGTLRSTLAAADPDTAAANATYSLWKKADDVLTAQQETALANPKVGRRIMASAGGAIAGEAAGGRIGAAVGLLTGRMVDAVASNASAAAKIAAARWLTQAAEAVRTGSAPRLQSAMVNYAKAAGVLDQFQGQISQAFAMPATASGQSEKR